MLIVLLIVVVFADFMYYEVWLDKLGQVHINSK